MPLSSHDSRAVFDSVNGAKERLRLMPQSPYAWVAISKRDVQKQSTQPSRELFFPALIDTGTSDNFVLHEWHLTHWCGLGLNQMRMSGKTKQMLGTALPLIKADLWISSHSERPEFRPGEQSSATKLDMSGGIIVSTVRCSKTFYEPDQLTTKKPKFLARLLGRSNDKQASVAEGQLLVMTEAKRASTTVPPDIHPRVPVIGVKLLGTNKLKFNLDTRSSEYSLQR